MECSYDNIDHSVSIKGSGIYDTNYKITLPLMRESLGIICFPFKYEKIYSEFNDILYAVRYENTLAKSEYLYLVNKVYLVL